MSKTKSSPSTARADQTTIPGAPEGARPPAASFAANKHGVRRGIVVASLAGAASQAFAAPAASAPAPARLGAVQGEFRVTRNGEAITLKAGAPLKAGDEFSAGEGGEAFVQFRDGAKLAIRPNSEVKLDAASLSGAVSTRETVIRLLKGGLRYISGKATYRKGVSFKTPTATIGIRGTDIEIAINDDPQADLSAGTLLRVNSGEAMLSAPDGTAVDVVAGEWALGAEPDLIPRGSNAKRRSQARGLDAALKAAAGGVFKAGALDKLMR
jgi:hypothetical protein